MLRAVSRSAFGRKLAGSTLYVHPERFTAAEVYGDALALKRCTGFEKTLKSGLTYKFDSPLPVPTTIAWGTRDLILPYVQSALAQERLPDVRHVALPRCGHVPMVDNPELVTQVIKETAA
ncbi:alpha/beta fold hydrolase [Aeromicrobium sp. UC242_57]|uniref:alpha/beta fold hydrolase n=1 Tax=Aeromicrobium sp. UC242_57 TaxID=3374624 RepID=UPI0037A16712